MGRGEEDREPFGVAVDRPSTGSVVVSVVGEIDLDSASLLVRDVLAAVEARPTDVRVVLEGVTFMDSTGTMALLELREAVTALGCRFTLVRPSRPVTLLFELSGLVDQFEVDQEGS